MTAMEPAQPGPMVSRQAAMPSTAPTPVAPHLGAFKPENLQRAEAMAKARGMLPSEYQNNPGACLLALDYAERYQLPIIEVTSQVSFRNGRATVGARLQRKLASRQGWRTKPVEMSETACTVAVYNPQGQEEGRAEYTIELANAIGHGKTNELYAKDPAKMLFHRATTRALDLYGPDELAGVFIEEHDEPDPIDAVERPAAPEAPAIEATGVEQAVAEARAQAPAVTEEQLRRAGKTNDILRTASRLGERTIATVEDVVADQDLAQRVLADLRG